MLPPGHVAGGYIAGTIVAFVTKSKTENYKDIQALGVLGGLLPDLDLVIYHSLRNRFNLSSNIEHHTWPTHTFPFYLIQGSLIAALAIVNKRPKLATYAVTLMVGNFTHLIQDMFGSGDGIMIFFPFSKRMFGVRLLDAHGKEWRKRYTKDPIFLVELTLIIIAFIIAIRKVPKKGI
ncbi:MAG: metal-dependent hydrolase [Chloroflexi bacterium]|nr:metal-dependent hydrolase [Chloroflexota bacterium]